MGCTSVKEVNRISKDQVVIEIRSYDEVLLENVLIERKILPLSNVELYNLICSKSRLVQSGRYWITPVERAALFRVKKSEQVRIDFYSPERIILKDNKYYMVVTD